MRRNLWRVGRLVVPQVLVSGIIFLAMGGSGIGDAPVYYLISQLAGAVVVLLASLIWGTPESVLSVATGVATICGLLIVVPLSWPYVLAAARVNEPLGVALVVGGMVLGIAVFLGLQDPEAV